MQETKAVRQSELVGCAADIASEGFMRHLIGHAEGLLTPKAWFAIPGSNGLVSKSSSGVIVDHAQVLRIRDGVWALLGLLPSL